MARIIDKLDGSRMFQLSQLENSLTDAYLSDVRNLQTSFIQDQFFQNDDLALSKLRLLNMSYAMPALISSIISSYVGNPLTALDINIEDATMAYGWGGYSVMMARIVDGQRVVDYITPDNYILDSDGTERIYTFYVVQEGEQIVTYILEQKYRKGVIENRLFKKTPMDSSEYSVHGEEVSLEVLPETSGLPEYEDTGLSRNPIVVVHNTKIEDYKYGTSELRKVQSLISSLEIQAVNIQDQFLKHLRAKMAIPTSKLPVDKNGYVNVNDLQYIGLNPGDPLPSYIINSNPLIQYSFDNMVNIIRQIAAVVGIPVEFFNIKETGGAESADAKSIRISNFVKKIEGIRDKFTFGITELFAVFAELGYKVEEDAIYWGDVFPRDTKALADEMTVAIDARIISRKRAIMRYQDIQEDEALLELEDINKENADVDLTSMLPS